MADEKPVGMRGRKYFVLFALLCIALAIETVNVRGGERSFSDVFRMVLGVAIWFVVFRRRRERVAMATLLVAAAVLNWGRYFAAESLVHALSLAEQLVLALFLCGAVYVILRDLFESPPPGAENVLGAICGYLIACDAWARLNVESNSSGKTNSNSATSYTTSTDKTEPCASACTCRPHYRVRKLRLTTKSDLRRLAVGIFRPIYGTLRDRDAARLE